MYEVAIRVDRVTDPNTLNSATVFIVSDVGSVWKAKHSCSASTDFNRVIAPRSYALKYKAKI